MDLQTKARKMWSLSSNIELSEKELNYAESRIKDAQRRLKEAQAAVEARHRDLVRANELWTSEWIGATLEEKQAWLNLSRMMFVEVNEGIDEQVTPGYSVQEGA